MQGGYGFKNRQQWLSKTDDGSGFHLVIAISLHQLYVFKMDSVCRRWHSALYWLLHKSSKTPGSSFAVSKTYNTKTET